MSQNWKDYLFKATGINYDTEIEKIKSQQIGNPIKVKYKNYKNEISIRTIIPLRVHYGNTQFHPENQWLLEVWDVDKDASRTYAMQDIIEFIKE